MIVIIIMLINMNMRRKQTADKAALPSKWKMKIIPDNSFRELRLSAPLRRWLDSHEHFHGCREILAVIRSRAVLCLNGRPVRLSPGDFLVIEPWVRHTAGHLPDDSAVFWWCMVEAGRFRMLLWRHNRIDSYQIIEAEDFARLLDRTFAETGNPAVAAELQHFVGGLICRFFRTAADPVPASDVLLYQETSVQKVLAWLENLPVLKCSLREAASLAGYSQTHFQRLFKQTTGKSFYDYLQQRRLERYRDLRSKRNIIKKELASLLGFASTAALNHWERRIKAADRQAN